MWNDTITYFYKYVNHVREIFYIAPIRIFLESLVIFDFDCMISGWITSPSVLQWPKQNMVCNNMKFKKNIRENYNDQVPVFSLTLFAFSSDFFVEYYA